MKMNTYLILWILAQQTVQIPIQLFTTQNYQVGYKFVNNVVVHVIVVLDLPIWIVMIVQTDFIFLVIIHVEIA